MDFGSVDVVSFDLFQTLVFGPFEEPADAFDVLGSAGVGRAVVDFRQKRLDAKRWATSSNGEEVPLRERYRVFEERHGLSSEAAQALMQAELELELRSARPCAVTRSWFEAALAQGKTVCITSDTFLPREFVERLLERTGFGGWHRLYVSSELGLLKSTGRLFEHLLLDLGVAPERVLHLGDHPVSDGRRPRELGIRTQRRPPPGELFTRCARGAPHMIRGDRLGERTVRGLVARRFASRWTEQQPVSFVGPSAEQIGFALFGPMLFGFTRWLAARLEAQGVDAVYFLSRDGHVMKRAYDAMRERRPELPPSGYLWASRRATSFPALKTQSDVLALLALPCAPLALRELLTARFALAEAELARVRPDAFGFRDWDTRVHPTGDQAKLVPLLESLSEVILSHAARERETVRAYLERSGLISARRPAVVDLGHQGTLQRSIQRLSGRGDLLGFYFATVAAIAAAGVRAESYLGFSAEDPSTLRHYEPRLQMFELLFPNDEGSVVRIRSEDGDFGVETASAPEDEPRAALSRELHRGALDFVGELLEALGDGAWASPLEPRAVIQPYLAFLRRPSRADAAVFAGVRVENVFSGRPSMPVLGTPTQPHSGLWPEGALALAQGREPALAWSVRLLQLVEIMGLSNRKLRKLARDPRAFLRDSRFGLLRRLGRLA